jgi:DNA-binding NarL/FixJ family response regulator
MPRPRVIIADDHTLLVEAFRKLLEPHCDVVGTAADGRSLLEIAPKLDPDVIFIDISMPLLNGLEAGVRLKKLLRNVKLVFLTMNEDPDLATEAMRSGASGYLLKTSAAEELIRSIQVVLKGRHYVTPRIAREMEKAFIDDPRVRDHKRVLTPRQREVVQLLAEGKSMKEAAGILNLTQRTVAFHKYRAMGELNIRTTAELIQYAIKMRILVP